MCRVTDTLSEALADTVSQIGFTRRGGQTRLVHASIADLISAQPHSIPGLGLGSSAKAAPQLRTALVFGREENGLHEEELRLCR